MEVGGKRTMSCAEGIARNEQESIPGIQTTHILNPLLLSNSECSCLEYISDLYPHGSTPPSTCSIRIESGGCKSTFSTSFPSDHYNETLTEGGEPIAQFKRKIDGTECPKRELNATN
jgi:hypothetical protein